MTTEVKKILFPTDLSKYARYAFNYAASIANRYGATISILHIMEELPTNVEAQIASFMGEDPVSKASATVIVFLSSAFTTLRRLLTSVKMPMSCTLISG